MTGANDCDPGCIEELTAAAAREWVHLVSEIETLPKRYGTAILEPAHSSTELSVDSLDELEFMMTVND